jgi:hypothetical protein
MRASILCEVLLVILIFTSCQKEIYYFSDDEKLILVYETGDSFNLLVEPSLDTLKCKVVSKEIYHRKDKYAFHIGPTYSEICDINIEGDSLKIDLEFIKTLEGLIINFTGNYINFSDFLNFAFASEKSQNLFKDSVLIHQKLYKNVQIIEGITGSGDTLFYSSEKGILKFSNSGTGEVFTLIDK